MEIHRQQCQACKSFNLHILLVRKANEGIEQAYVVCKDCGEPVAKYELSAYFHKGRGIESFLNSMARRGDISSSRKIPRVETLEKNFVEEWQELKSLMKESGKSFKK